MKYPVPTPHRWTVAVEFPDGDRIEGTSDADVMERWAKRAEWALADGELSVRELKRTIARRAMRVEEQHRDIAIRRGWPVPEPKRALPFDGPDDEFLNEGAFRGLWAIIRK